MLPASLFVLAFQSYSMDNVNWDGEVLMQPNLPYGGNVGLEDDGRGEAGAVTCGLTNS